MATEYEVKLRTANVVTPRALDDAYDAAEAALRAYTQPEEVRPGLHLCCRGRLYRAHAIAAGQPPEKYAVIEVETRRLAAVCDARFARLTAAERYYRELCRNAGTEPKSTTLEPCDCEGCRLETAALEHIQRGVSHG